MAIRFTSFETYKNALADKETGKTSMGGIFLGEQHNTLKFDSPAPKFSTAPLIIVIPSDSPRPFWEIEIMAHDLLIWTYIQ